MELLGHAIRLTLALFLLGLCIHNLPELHEKFAGNLKLLLVTYIQFDIDVNSAPDLGTVAIGAIMCLVLTVCVKEMMDIWDNLNPPLKTEVDY